MSIKKLSIRKIVNEIRNQMQLIDASDSTISNTDFPRTSKLYPASVGQKRLWFLENFEPGNSVYNMPLDYRIKGVLDVPVLEKSIETLIDRHESLRTVILTSGNDTLQKVIERYPYVLKVENLEHLSVNEKSTLEEKYSTENEIHIFNIETGPLFIFKLLKIGSAEWRLLINIHNSISDEWSVKILFEELGLIYG